MSEWYEIVPADAPLMQGDFIFKCRVPTWKRENIELSGETEEETLKALLHFIEADVIVMTQACDLEQNHVQNVTLCPHLPLSKYKEGWERFMTARKQGITPNAWRKQCDNLRDGFIWNQSLLNSSTIDEFPFEHRVADFYDVYTLPRVFLESLLKNRGNPRPRLLPPYREHLSQAFARFYMRVGLPTPINKGW